MEKLSTNKLKELISIWLSTDEIKKLIKDFYSFSDKENDDLEEFNFIWKLWCNSKLWKRGEKRKLKNNWKEYFYKNSPNEIFQFKVDEYSFVDDFYSWYDKQKVEYYFNNPKEAEKCILRMFFPDNEMGDNFRLEIISNSEDTEIIGWVIMVD